MIAVNETSRSVFRDIIPNNSKLLRVVIPALGHDQITSFEDIVDNSFDAMATEIKILISEGKKEKITSYTIVDNGCGMDEDTLVESFRFATNIEHTEGDLGKYGVGGTVSCFTLGNTKKTITKTKNGKIIVGELDTTNTSNNCDKCSIRIPTPNETELFNEYCPESGTIIVISNVRDLQYTNARHLKNRLITSLGTTFYQRLNSNRSIVIELPKKEESTRVAPADPLYKSDENKVNQKSLYSKKFNFAGSIIAVTFMEIDRLTTESSDRSSRDAGLYFNRNNRLISSGQVHKTLWPSKHQTYNCGRVEISFSEDLDEYFGLAALKNKVSPNSEIINLLLPDIKAFHSQVAYSSRNAPSSKTVEELEEEDENWTKQLKSNAAILDLHKSTKSSDSNIIRINSGEKKGSVSSKETGITRTARERIVPEWAYVEEPRTPQPYWHHWDEGRMYITINLCHPFIKQHYKSESEKILIKKFLTAHSLAAFDISIESDVVSENVSIYLDKVSTKLNAVDKSVK